MSSSSEQIPQKTVDRTSEDSLLTKFMSQQYIRQRIDEIKRDDDQRNENDLKSSDKRRSHILDMAEYMEAEMQKYGSDFMVSEISAMIIRMFEKTGLDKYVYLIWEVLPDKYKNKTKDTYKRRVSKVMSNKIKRHLMEIQSINMALLDTEDLYEIKNLSLAIPDNCDRQLLETRQPLTNEFSDPKKNDPLAHLKKMEDNKFKKATMGEPISTADQLCRDPQYATAYGDLTKEFDKGIRGWQIMKEFFTEKYPPLSVEHCILLTDGLKDWNEYWRPYYDRKYRRDHVQSIKTAYTRVLHTSTKASHESQIACAHHLDKKGMPVMRGLTKEQIDAMYEWEVNFQQRLLNTFMRWPEKVTTVYAAHAARAGEDRAVDLSGTLSHHA